MSTIGIIAPSSRGEIAPESIAALEARGHSVVIHPQCYLEDHQSAGTAQQRADAVMDVFSDRHIDIVMAARGGNRSMHILPYLDFDVIAKNAKPLISFSDGTALLNAIYTKTGMTGFHGPTLSRIARAGVAEFDQMFACLQGRPNSVDLSASTVLHGGRVTAPMVGGNLSVFTSLCGTPYMPDCRGKIVFLEDIGDQLSRYDRMLAQLRLAGVFDAAAAVIFGVMHAEGDSSVTPFGFELDAIVREHTAHLKTPVLIHAPFGHKGLLPTFPVGGMVTLDAGAGTLLIE
jgi:muramoyltetrapeptide carboxypeptidase